MIDLQSGENVFYPMPFVEGEAHLLVITNQRIVHFGEMGKQEMAAKQVQFVGRSSGRPFATLGVILALLALPSIGFGVYSMITSGLFASAKSAASSVAAGDDPSVPAAEQEDEAPPQESSTASKVLGIVAVAVGLLLLVAGVLLVRVQRHFVIVRGGSEVVQIRARTPMEQTQIIATLGALQTSAKAPGTPAEAAPQVQVDDKGDPVKALQELAQARAAGKIGDDEFDAKRDVLVQRVRNRR